MNNGPGNSDSESQRQQLNAEGARMLREKARDTRLQLINFATRVLVWRAAEDENAKQVLADGPADTSVGLYVLPDALYGVVREDSVTETLSLKWVRDDELRQDGDKQLIVYIPVDEHGELPHVSPEDDVPIDESELPDEMFLAITHEDDSVSRYIISKDAIEQYVSAGDTGRQDIYDELHPAVWSRQVTRRVDTGLPLTDQVGEDLINMDTMPQRTISNNPDIDPVDY